MGPLPGIDREERPRRGLFGVVVLCEVDGDLEGARCEAIVDDRLDFTGELWHRGLHRRRHRDLDDHAGLVDAGLLLLLAAPQHLFGSFVELEAGGGVDEAQLKQDAADTATLHRLLGDGARELPQRDEASVDRKATIESVVDLVVHGLDPMLPAGRRQPRVPMRRPRRSGVPSGWACKASVPGVASNTMVLPKRKRPHS